MRRTVMVWAEVVLDISMTSGHFELQSSTMKNDFPRNGPAKSDMDSLPWGSGPNPRLKWSLSWCLLDNQCMILLVLRSLSNFGHQN